MSKLPPGGVPLTGLAAGAPEQPAKPELSNYEVLNANRVATLKFADSIAVTSLVQPPAERGISLENLVKGGKWSKAIIMLDEMKDNKLGIVWHESEDLGQGTRAIVRDARKVTTDPVKLKQEAGEKYAMQILNEVRGGLALLETSADVTPEQQKRNQEARDRLEFIAQQAVADIDSLNSKTIKKFNTQIVHSLETAGIEGAAEKLVFAKEIGNLRDDHRHIVTLTHAKGNDGTIHTVTEADIMLGGLTDKQKEQYDKVAKSTKGVDSGVEWFDRMDPYKKELVRGVASEIASGKKVIPTQFLSDLPGIKNAYQKVTAIRGPDDHGSRVLVQTLHCGTPATKIKVFKPKGQLSKALKHLDPEGAKKQEIANENIRQLQSFVGPDESINLNILNAKLPAGKGTGENFVFDQMHKAQAELGQSGEVSVTESSINRGRWIGGRDTTRFKKELKAIANALSREPDPVLTVEAVAWFQKGGSKKAIKAGIEEQRGSNPELASVLDLMVRARDLTEANTITADTSNISLDLTAKMNVIRSSVHLEDGALHKVLKAKGILKKISQSVDFCKSGKDRTGYVGTTVSSEAVNTYLDIDPQSGVTEENLLAQVAGNHTQEMAGVQGGTVGCHGIKLNKWTFGLTWRDHVVVKDILDQPSANFNSAIKVKEGKEAKAIITEFEAAFAAREMAAGGVVVGEVDLDAPDAPDAPEPPLGPPGSKPEDPVVVDSPPRSEDTKEYARDHQKALDKFKKDIEDHKQEPALLRKDIEVYKGELQKFEDAVRGETRGHQYFSEKVDLQPEDLAEKKSKIDILNDEMKKYVVEHKTALDSFKKNIEAHKHDPEALQKDIDEYKPKLETFEAVALEFQKKKEILQSIGEFVVTQDKPGAEKGSDAAMQSFGNAVVDQEEKKGVAANLKAITRAFGRLAKKPTKKAASGPVNTPTAEKKGQEQGPTRGTSI